MQSSLLVVDLEFGSASGTLTGQKLGSNPIRYPACERLETFENVEP
jgi:hypothetical protein